MPGGEPVQAMPPDETRADLSARRVWRVAYSFTFILFACLNLIVLIEANELAFAAHQQPFDFYVLLRGSSQVFSSPSQVYVWQTSAGVGPYWSHWLWNGSNYAYTPMFATAIYPLTALYPPIAKVAWELLSFATLVVSCALLVKRVPWPLAKIALTVMVFAMPLPILFTNQSLPVNWGLQVLPGMLISPVYFADYFFGNANTMILALGLLSIYFASREVPFTILGISVPAYALSALFLALDTFKVTAVVFVLPFWLFLNRKKLLRSLGLLVALVVLLNGVAIFEPVLISGYWSKLLIEGSIPTAQSPLWQLYEYVWYYTLPLAGTLAIAAREGWLNRLSKPRPAGRAAPALGTRPPVEERGSV